MKVKVNEDKCIGCGSCVSITDSKIFDFNDEGHAKAIREILEAGKKRAEKRKD